MERETSPRSLRPRGVDGEAVGARLGRASGTGTSLTRAAAAAAQGGEYQMAETLLVGALRGSMAGAPTTARAGSRRRTNGLSILRSIEQVMGTLKIIATSRRPRRD